MSFKEVAIDVSQLSKFYPIYSHPRDRLLQAIWGKRKCIYEPFWALRDVSFHLKRGQTLGVMGRNGSGKSTLLQLICGTLTPTSGSVRISGRIGALLELGSGFNPEFTGIENVFLNATLLGLRRGEIEAVLEDILAFADIGDFIHQPVKTYSSGMAVRLAFAVQAHVKPEVLVVDEALAVGDELFQKKCYAHLDRMKRDGTAILLVTHSCPQILQHCDEAILLHQGSLRAMGRPKEVTSLYQRLCNAPDEEWEAMLERVQHGDTKAASEDSTPKTPSSKVIYPSKGITINRITVTTEQGESTDSLDASDQYTVEIYCTAERQFEEISIACNLSNQTGIRITGQKMHIPALSHGQYFVARFHFRQGLLPGIYFVSAGIWPSQRPKEYIHRVLDYCTLRVTTDRAPESFGFCDLRARQPELIANETGI